MENENDPNIIILYYKYVRIEDPKEEMNIQREICEKLKLKGKKKKNEKLKKKNFKIFFFFQNK